MSDGPWRDWWREGYLQRRADVVNCPGWRTESAFTEFRRFLRVYRLVAFYRYGLKL